MSTNNVFKFNPAKREGVGLFVAVAGPSGSGKTYSALRIAKGIAGEGGKIAAIDTEARRMSHYCDRFNFDVADMAPPFRPDRFAQAAKDAEAAGYAVLVIDSFSLEWTGEGGVLEWHDEEVDRMAGDDAAKRERVKMAAWIKPKTAHKAMIASFLQRRIPIVFCLRAEEKTGIGQGGKPVALGWTPIGDPRFLYELTTSVTLSNEAPGRVSYQLPHKVQEQHRSFLPHGELLGEDAGERLRDWANGAAGGETVDWPAFDSLSKWAVWSTQTFLPTAEKAKAQAWHHNYSGFMKKLAKSAETKDDAKAALDALMEAYGKAVAEPAPDDDFGSERQQAA